MRILKQSHRPSGFLNIQFAAKYQKKIEGGPFGDIIIFSKNVSVPKKSKRDPLVT